MKTQPQTVTLEIPLDKEDQKKVFDFLNRASRVLNFAPEDCARILLLGAIDKKREQLEELTEMRFKSLIEARVLFAFSNRSTPGEALKEMRARSQKRAQRKIATAC